MLRTKPGVRVNGTRPEMHLALVALLQAATRSLHDIYITSWRDGSHSNASLHYVGFAVDADIAGEAHEQEVDAITNDLSAVLTKEFDLVVEEKEGKFSHWHIEFQPKLSDGDRIKA